MFWRKKQKPTTEIELAPVIENTLSNQELLENWLQGNLAPAIGRIKQEPSDRLSGLFLVAGAAVGSMEWGQLSRNEVLNHFQASVDFGVANFLLNSRIGETFHVHLGGHPVEITPQKTNRAVNSDQWIDVFTHAVLIRDERAVRHLCASPDKLHGQAHRPANQFDLDLVATLKGYFQEGADLEGLLTNAAHSAYNTPFDQVRMRFVNEILDPALKTLADLTVNEGKRFSELVEDALNRHVAHYKLLNQGSNENNQGNYSPLLSLICTIGVEKLGLSNVPQHPVLPEWLIRGDFQ